MLMNDYRFFSLVLSTLWEKRSTFTACHDLGSCQKMIGRFLESIRIVAIKVLERREALFNGYDTSTVSF